MVLFILKRIFYFILTLPLVIWLSLLLFKASPIDPVEQMINPEEIQSNREFYTANYINVAKKHHLNQPIFYFSVTNSLIFSEYFELVLPESQNFHKYLMLQGWTFQEIEELLDIFLGFKPKVKESDSLSEKEKDRIKNPFLINSEISLNSLVQNMGNEFSETPDYSKLKELVDKNRNSNFSKKFIPAFHWHGKNNQFHYKISSLLSGNLGVSMKDGQTVQKKIFSALYITLFLMLFPLLFVLPLGIWLGKMMSSWNSRILKLVESILLFFSSIPVFWLATLLLVFFTTPEYGRIFHIFPSVNSFGFRADNSFLENITNNISQLVLPTLTILLTDLAIIMRQTNQLLNQQSEKPYVLTARMKGLSNAAVISDHTFLNIKPQLLTMISNGIVSSFSGVLVIEYIFNIPGMGRLLLDSINAGDNPVVFGIIILLFGVASLIFLLTDLVYVKIDPRLSKNL